MNNKCIIYSKSSYKYQIHTYRILLFLTIKKQVQHHVEPVFFYLLLFLEFHNHRCQFTYLLFSLSIFFF